MLLLWMTVLMLAGEEGKGTGGTAGGGNRLSGVLPCPVQCECFFDRAVILEADCSAQDLIQLPPKLDPQTQILDLSDNNFESIPPEVSSIIYLERLNLSGNLIKILPANSLNNLTTLEVLDLSRNLIFSWEDINANYLLLPAINLRKLILSKNPINSFGNLKDKEFLISDNLQSLELNDCEIPVIYGRTPIGGLTVLEHLSLSRNPLRRIQKLVSPTLKTLDISHCELNYVSYDELNYLPALVRLRMSHNYRLVISARIGFIASISLRHIDISYCNVNRASLSSFPNLREVNLKGNMIRHLMVGDLSNNSHLISLDLSSNAIGSIHQNAFDGLTSLKILNLSVNVIPNVHNMMFQNLPNLTVLSLSRNYLSSVGNIRSPSLELLDMSTCEIQAFSADSLSGMSALTEINLSRNLITEIPENLKSKSLRILDLSFNRISALNNETLRLLPELTTLHLSENRFSETWKVSYFSSNTKLQEISMKDNTWRCDCHETEMRALFGYLTDDPPKVWNTKALECHGPSDVSGKTWLEACYFIWNPQLSAKNDRMLTFLIVIVCSFLGCFSVIYLVRRAMRRKMKAAQREQDRRTAEARDRQRELRARRDQEQQRNAPDPRDLVSPPSYDEALLMPRMDGSYHSLADVGLGQTKLKKRARRRTRSSGDLLEEVDRAGSGRRRSTSGGEGAPRRPEPHESDL